MPDASPIQATEIGRAQVPVMRLLARAWLDLTTSGFCDGLPYMYDHEVLWIERGGRPVACLTWSFSKWNGRAFIHIGYVRPKHRKRGLYRSLYEEAKKRAAEKGALRIEGYVRPENEGMMKACAAMGRTAVATVWSEDLPRTRENGEDNEA